MFSRSSNKSPPSFPGYYCVGWVKSAHGIRGEIFIQLYAGTADWLPGARGLELLCSPASDLRHFELVSASAHKDGLIAQLKSVDSRNASEALRRSLVYVVETLLASPPEEGIFLRQIEGFELLDSQGQVLGVIIGFASNGPQDLLRIRRDQKGRDDKPDKASESLVPLVDAFLMNIDFDKKQVTMDLPPGLLSVEDE
ncbi:MAG: ribosome maturation factor RimM [Bdellovibrionales bacterium]